MLHSGLRVHTTLAVCMHWHHAELMLPQDNHCGSFARSSWLKLLAQFQAHSSVLLGAACSGALPVAAEIGSAPRKRCKSGSLDSSLTFVRTLSSVIISLLSNSYSSMIRGRCDERMSRLPSFLASAAAFLSCTLDIQWLIPVLELLQVLEHGACVSNTDGRCQAYWMLPADYN